MASCSASSCSRASVQRRKLNLKVRVESSLSYFRFKALSYRRYHRGFDRVKLHRPTSAAVARASASAVASFAAAATPATSLYRRKLKLKAIFKSSQSYFSFKRLVPGAFNVSFIG